MMESEIETTPPANPGCGVAALALAGGAALMSVPLAVATGTAALYPFVLFFTLAVVAVLGTPIFLLIRAAGRATWPRVAAGGFIAGALGPLLLALPFQAPDQASIDNVVPVADGSYTAAGWSQTLMLIGEFGLAGIVGAMISWLLIGLATRSENRPVMLAGIALLVASAIGVAALIPSATMDRSCHNPLRLGGTSISPVAEIELDIPMTDWPAARREFEGFARDHGWSIMADTRPDKDFPWFQASLCTEAGTVIFAAPLPRDAGERDQDDMLSITVTQPQGGNSWQSPFHALQNQLEARWPGKISYRYDPYGGPRPPWAPPAPSSTPKAPLAAPK